MSLLEVVDLIEFPNRAVLNGIANSSLIRVISPFYSGWSIRKLTRARSDSNIQLITRLPTQYQSPTRFLDNDPAPLKEAMVSLGSRLRIFAMPNVHAKMYLCDDTGWVGSSNLTNNGFSGKGELLIKISPVGGLQASFERFRRGALQVTYDNLNYLTQCLSDGLTTLVKPRGKTQDDQVIPNLSYEGYGLWLRQQPGNSWLVGRMENDNNMSGHVYSAFFGAAAFLLRERKYAAWLLAGKGVNQAIENDLADFVLKFGSRVSGPRGGTWNRKLSEKLGGTHSNGGAGDVIVLRSLPFVARYLRQIGAL